MTFDDSMDTDRDNRNRTNGDQTLAFTTVQLMEGLAIFPEMMIIFLSK
jgi:hypothetical protein